MLTRSQLLPYPSLLALLDSQSVTRWIGPKRHIIAYPVSSHQIYNISTAQPDVHFSSAPDETYTTQASKTDMLQTFSDFSPDVRSLLELVPEGDVCEWKLRVHAPLPTWVAHQVALVGDSCHPTLPHMAQGAAQAIEDAAVVAVCLAMLPDSSPEAVNKGLRVYEKLRKERAEALVDFMPSAPRRMSEVSV